MRVLYWFLYALKQSPRVTGEFMYLSVAQATAARSSSKQRGQRNWSGFNKNPEALPPLSSLNHV